MRRPLDLSSLLLVGVCAATLGCESANPRVLVPNLDLPATEQVNTPVQITERESAPPLHG